MSLRLTFCSLKIKVGNDIFIIQSPYPYKASEFGVILITGMLKIHVLTREKCLFLHCC